MVDSGWVRRGGSEGRKGEKRQTEEFGDRRQKKGDLECCKMKATRQGRSEKCQRKKTPNESSRLCVLYHAETSDSALHRAVCTEVKGQLRGERDKRSGCRGGGRNDEIWLFKLKVALF